MKKLGKKAFTLIELLVVIAVVGILVLFGAPRFTGYTQKAELTRIQHDIKVMEQEVGTVLINNDDFNKWENNSKDFNQLIQEGKLFEKEGIAKEVDARHLASSNKTRLNVGGELHPISELPEDLSIDKTYKIIPEEFSKKINTKLKGTFYANNNGKVYYEHVKSLSGIPTDTEKPSEPGEKEPVLEGPIPIATAEELNSIRNKTTRTYGKGTKWEGLYEGGLDKQYFQVADVNLSEYSEKDGWTPIGTELSGFTGSFDGNGYNITGLVINRSTEMFVGLFGYTDRATIINVALEDINVTGGSYAGGLVGSANGSMIENSYATGSVTGEGWIGGLVGSANNSSRISNSYSTGKVTGGSSAGGLVGRFENSTIENSYSTGLVEGLGSLGGLVGSAMDGSNINNSYATGSVKGKGDNVGGLVGHAASHSKDFTNISNSYATGSVTSSGDYVGGLVGRASSNSTNSSTNISNSYATGSVTGGDYNVGGLVGWANNRSTKISNSYATGSVTGTGIRVGGLVGYADESTIENSYAIGLVTGTGSTVGGLVGYSEWRTTISNSYWAKTTEQSTSDGGIGKSTDEMKQAETYSEWDTDVWNIVNGEYPTLKNRH